MILPHPETDLNTNILVVGADIISILLKEKKYIFLETLMDKFIKNDSSRTLDLFIDSLTFLYCFDLIENQGYKVRINTKIKHPELF